MKAYREQLETRVLLRTLVALGVLASVTFASLLTERAFFHARVSPPLPSDGMLALGFAVNVGAILLSVSRKRPLSTLRRLGLSLVVIDFAIVVTDALVFSVSLVGIIFSFLSMVAFVVIGGIFTGRTVPQLLLAALIVAGYVVAVLVDPARHAAETLPAGDDGTRISVWGLIVLGALLVSVLVYRLKEGILMSYFRWISLYDAETGLPNGKLLDEDLAERVLNLPDGNRIMLFGLRLDGFGDLSGLMGHDAANRWFEQLTASISSVIDQWTNAYPELSFLTSRRVYRVETHVFLSPAVVSDPGFDLLGCVRNLQTRIKGAFLRNESESGMGFFGAFSVYPDDGDSVSLLRGNVYRLLTRVTGQARNTIVPFDPVLHTRYLREVELRGAILRPDFVAYLETVFQPKVHVGSGRCVGFEALARWNPPGLGRVPPDEFIPIAEETPAIEALTGFIIAETIGFIRQLNDAYQDSDVRVSFNLSPRLVSESFLASLVRRLETTAESRQLEIEITEGVLLRETEEIRDYFRRLRALGVHFSIDDFGAGYSNIAYLQGFRADTLKIDRRFVGNLPANEEDGNLVRAMLGLARVFSMRAVVEGVENREQERFLADNGCEYIQGFLYSRPVSAKDALAFYGKQRDPAPLLS